jgi:hypothetical protein
VACTYLGVPGLNDMYRILRWRTIYTSVPFLFVAITCYILALNGIS